MTDTQTEAKTLIEKLKECIPPSRLKTRQVDLVAYAADAGFYYLVPIAVVQVVNEQEIISLFQFSHSHKIPLVFRTGGTSLSGQSITNGILVDLSRFWNRLTVIDNGHAIRLQPGITGGLVNAYLSKYQRKIGPDPSSISAAMIGGILSNNSSGMCCGVKYNSYHTTRFIKFILPGGQTFSTENKADYPRFLADCAFLAGELSATRNQVLADPFLSQKIRGKYKTKNTVGYSLNAFMDYEHPLDIFAHLLIGAEGTLAFIAEAVMETIPDEPCKATALLYFPGIHAACEAVIPLVESNAAMVELMDRNSLAAIEELPGVDTRIKELPATAAALLIEFQAGDMQQLQRQVDAFLALAHEMPVLYAPAFTTDAVEREFLWKIRKGLFPAVGAVRKSGTTVILEDVAFPLAHMGNAIIDLQALFLQYGYTNAIIFGHAKDGNIHFVVTQAFDSAEEINRYNGFLNEVVELVVNKYDGALKAEHGTGRNMAPFVETEWGGDAYKIMQRIKHASDPENLLNPGVIINADKEVHIKNLKQLPVVEQEVDKCIECGYCEPVCPSRDLTLTPRRRIVVRRELAKLKASGENEQHRQLLKEYEYDGLETCAVDGLCANACPVSINTGDLVKRLRRENHAPMANRMALLAAKQFKWIERSMRLALAAGNTANKLTGQKTMSGFTQLVKKIMPSFPLWPAQGIKAPAFHQIKKQIKAAASPGTGTAIVYFPACITRLLGTSAAGKKNLVETFLEVAGKAGVAVKMLEQFTGTCCGQIFSSKGYSDAYKFTANNIIEQIWKSTNQGQLPVVMDVSSCTYTLQHLRPVLTPVNQSRFDQLSIMDSVDFLFELVMPVCAATSKKDSIVLHPVCSLKKMGTEHKFRLLAQHYAHNVTIPLQAGCCGMAGDRGFLFPELTASATYFEAAEVKATQYDGYYSSTKTCEIALSQAISQNYESILYLVNETTR